MSRFSTKRGDEIHYSMWLVIDAQGEVRMTRGEPATGRGEVAMALTVKAPLSLFRKPLLRAEVTVPAGATLAPDQALQSVVEILRTGSDLDIDVRIQE